MNNSTNQNDQEIDLSSIFVTIKNFFISIINYINETITFLFKNIIWTFLIVIAGFIVGFYLDSTNNGQKHLLYVTPNFGSVDYLYAKIDLLNSKIKNEDTLFLSKIGLTNGKNISKIKIAPILDPYTFVRSNETNFDLLKSLAEDSDMNKVIKDQLTSKHFAIHQIEFSTKGLATENDIFIPLFNYFNDSEYYSIVQKNIVENYKIKLQSNQQTIDQINDILNSFGQTVSSTGSKSDKLVYYNDNTQLNEILNTKDFLIKEQAGIRLEMIDFDKIIKLKSANINAPTSSIAKFIIPIIFLLLFSLFGNYISLYKKRKQV